MERKRIICRIFVLTLLAVAALSLCAFADADPPYYFDYKIKGNDVYLRSAPATANQYNVIGILQNNEPIMVWEWVYGTDNDYEWGYGRMAAGSCAGMTGYVPSMFLTPNN